MLSIVGQTIPWKLIVNNGFGAVTFTVLTFACYGVIYLLPSIVMTWSVFKISNFKNHTVAKLYPAYITATLIGGITTLLLYANAKIFSLYGTFINGFVTNLVMTPGGIESLGGSNASSVGFALIALAFMVAQAFILWLAIIWQRKVSSLRIPKKFNFWLYCFINWRASDLCGE